MKAHQLYLMLFFASLVGAGLLIIAERLEKLPSVCYIEQEAYDQHARRR